MFQDFVSILEDIYSVTPSLLALNDSELRKIRGFPTGLSINLVLKHYIYPNYVPKNKHSAISMTKNNFCIYGDRFICPEDMGMVGQCLYF